MSHITLEFLQELLDQDCSDVVIKEFEGAPGSNRGDNYTSMVYRVTLSGVKKKTTEDGTVSEEPWHGSIIYKCLPESHVRREAFKSEELFCNEVAFYNKIWPAFTRFQAKWDVKHPFKGIPKCYLARNDMVVLKDLKPMGFLMPDRRQGLSIEQSYFVMKNLAQFHALSLAMKFDDSEEFFELLNTEDGISEVYFVPENKDYYKDYYLEAAQNAIDMVEDQLKDHDNKEIYLEKFKKFCSEDTFYETMLELVSPKEPLAVISHGDFWTNNMLFRYVDADIAEMCIVDFQLARYASLTLDLTYVFYLCLTRQQRSEHMSSLLEYYVDELHGRLVELSSDEAVFNNSLARDNLFSMIKEEFRQNSRFGLGMALDMYPIMMCDSNEAPNVYQEENEVGSSHDDMKPVWTSNEACRRKMTNLVMELVDEGLL